MGATLGLLALTGGACRPGSVHTSAVEGGIAEQGPALFRQYGCGTCHVASGTRGAVGRVGPSLDGFAVRMYIAGTVTNSPENLVRWIQDPRALQPRTAMPDVGVTEEHARHLAAYLYTLR